VDAHFAETLTEREHLRAEHRGMALMFLNGTMLIQRCHMLCMKDKT
jgi:hypothetical protein